MWTLAIIEPNLRTHAGHYAAFVETLASRAGDASARLRVFAHPDADAILEGLPCVETPLDEGRANRFMGEWRVLWNRIRDGQPTLVLTASAKHALICSVLSFMCGSRPQNLALYFHWKETKPAQRLMHRLASRVRQTSLAITPLASIANELERSGWKRVHCLPYPMAGPRWQPEAIPFEKVMMGGAARLNKGLSLVVELAERWAGDAERAVPLHLQVTPKHHGRHGHREQALVERLHACRYNGLQLDLVAPAREAYHSNFKGALVLAPYDRERFADGVSGVVLDALLCGSPVIATAGTWAGRLVQRFNAGMLLESPDVLSLERAIDQCIADWKIISSNACNAAAVLRDEHDPARLINLACHGQA
jgi:hypothetical protein